MKRTLSLFIALVLCLALLPAAALAADHYDGETFRVLNVNEDAVTQGKPSSYGVILYSLQNVTYLNLRLSSVTTYHYNNGKGSPLGTISIWKDNTEMVGKWQATGSDYVWTIYPDVILEGGHKYYFYTSSPSTWSYNEASNDVCFIDIQGTWTSGSSAGTGEWKKVYFANSTSAWWYRYPDGSYPYSQWDYIDGKWYHFSAKGYMQTGWLYDSGNWYYLGSSGPMVTGWKLIQGYWYWFDGNGVMAIGWRTIDGKEYYFDDNGAWQKDAGYTQGKWVYSENGWRYQVYGGDYVRIRPYEIDGKWYWFTSDGYLRTGWYMDPSGTWYYFGSDGEVRVDWQKIGGEWYYFSRGTGVARGAMATGWEKVGGEWYYFGGDGAMRHDCWVGSSYLGSNGVWQPNGPGGAAG